MDAHKGGSSVVARPCGRCSYRRDLRFVHPLVKVFRDGSRLFFKFAQHPLFFFLEGEEFIGDVQGGKDGEAGGGGNGGLFFNLRHLLIHVAGDPPHILLVAMTPDGVVLAVDGDFYDVALIIVQAHQPNLIDKGRAGGTGG